MKIFHWLKKFYVQKLNFSWTAQRSVVIIANCEIYDQFVTGIYILNRENLYFGKSMQQMYISREKCTKYKLGSCNDESWRYSWLQFHVLNNPEVERATNWHKRQDIETSMNNSKREGLLRMCLEVFPERQHRRASTSVSTKLWNTSWLSSIITKLQTLHQHAKSRIRSAIFS